MRSSRRPMKPLRRRATPPPTRLRRRWPPSRPTPTPPKKLLKPGGTPNMASSTQEWIDELKTISVLELTERIKALEEEFGVSATAVAAAAPAAGGGADGGGAREGGGTAGGVGLTPPRGKKNQGIKGRPPAPRPRP